MVEDGYHRLQYPFLAVSDQGLALPFTSPALALAAYARCAPQTLTLWAVTLAVALPEFLYYTNGWIQVGMRHALDFEPFVIVLMAFALRENPRRWFVPLLGLSIALGLWQAWYAHQFRCC